MEMSNSSVNKYVQFWYDCKNGEFCVCFATLKVEGSNKLKFDI